jgi:hypothetical protein
MNFIKQWIMLRYCPEFEAKMPEDEPGKFLAEAIITYGYWGHRSKVFSSKIVEGKRQAYITARWLALKAQWRRPTPFFDCGIYYGVVKA